MGTVQQASPPANDFDSNVHLNQSGRPDSEIIESKKRKRDPLFEKNRFSPYSKHFLIGISIERTISAVKTGPRKGSLIHYKGDTPVAIPNLRFNHICLVED